jgi:hypothetical protein
MKTRYNKSKTSAMGPTEREKVEVKTTKPTTIPTLRYDRSTSTNFHSFQKALEIAAGAEFGLLFSFSRTGKYPRYDRPMKRTVELERLNELRQAQEIDDAVDQQEAIAAINQEYSEMTAEEIRVQDEIFEITWKAELGAIAKEEAKMHADKSKLYWKVRGHLSPESWDKVQEHLSEDAFKKMEINQDPLYSCGLH